MSAGIVCWAHKGFVCQVCMQGFNQGERNPLRLVTHITEQKLCKTKEAIEVIRTVNAQS